MAWPTGGIPTTHLNSGSDSPAAARDDLLQTVVAVNAIVASRGQADGVAGLDDGGKLPASQLPTSGLLPSGVMLPYAGATEPSGWLLCYGQAVSRTTYAALFAAIGTTFNVPDMRGRVPAGRDDMGGTAASRLTAAGGVTGTTLGATGGTETHTLTEAQMPLHGHPLRESVVAQSGAASATTGGVMLYTSNQTNQPAYTGTPTATAGQQLGGTGGGAAHPNVQPTLVSNYIIKT